MEATLVSLRTLECGQCGITFAVPELFIQERQDNGGNWHCPNGHQRVFREPEVKRLQRELESTRTELRSAKCETLAERQKREALEVSSARLKRRIKNGVCPCCKRTVKQLAAHMKSKHPDYVST